MPHSPAWLWLGADLQALLCLAVLPGLTAQLQDYWVQYTEFGPFTATLLGLRYCWHKTSHFVTQ